MTIDVIMAMIAISGITTGVTMAYINLLHKITEKDFKDVRKCINEKFDKGKAEHLRIDNRIDKICL